MYSREIHFLCQLSAERSVVRIQLAARISQFQLAESLILPDVERYRISLDLGNVHMSA